MNKKITFGVVTALILAVMFSVFGTNKSGNPSASIYDIEIGSLMGEPIDLSAFKDKKILFVNVASECGFTPQYEALQELHETYGDKVTVIGLPCNQFGGQEPGTPKEIKQFCETKFNVSFPMTEKVDVKGDNQHPLYAWLTKKELNGVKNSSVKWNFQKYLVDENGNFVDVWYSITKPTSKKITKHFE